MSLVNRGVQQVSQPVYERVCDQCGEAIPALPKNNEDRIVLSWDVLDLFWYDDQPELPESPVDLCGIACCRAFLDRAEAVFASWDNPPAAGGGSK